MMLATAVDCVDHCEKHATSGLHEFWTCAALDVTAFSSVVTVSAGPLFPEPMLKDPTACGGPSGSLNKCEI
jgi:hypothetical protein